MKKHWSRFISALLVATMLFSVMLPFGTAGAAETGVQNQNRVRLLSALGVDIDTQKDTVTRADFAVYIYKAFRLENIEFNGQMPYQDVPENEPYYNMVGVLYQLGVLSASERFNPNNIITTAEMAKMMVSALGYDLVAQELGGYPSGYIMCAQTLDISLGGNTPSGSMIPDILFSMLEAHPNLMLTEDHITISDDVDCFLAYHHVRPVKGVITSNEITSIYRNIHTAGAGQITLDGISYAVNPSLTDGKRTISNYLGSSIEAYVYDYDGEDERIIYFDTDDSIFVELNTADVDKDGFTLRAYPDGKKAKYNLALNFSVIWNGKNCSDYTDADFEALDGTMLLIDNNRDGSYDVVSIEKPEYLFSQNVQAATQRISDQNKHTYGALNTTYIQLDDSDCVYEYFIHDGGQIREATLEALESFETFEIIMSRDEQYIRITGFSNVVSGDITEYSDATPASVSINGIAYEKTEYALAHNPYVEAGTYTLAYLTPENKLIYFDSTENNMRYGYLMKLDKRGNFGEYAAALLMETGAKEYVYFKDYISLDGDRVKTNFDDHTGMAYIKLSQPYQLIKYSLDKDGKIACIDTADNVSYNVEDIYTVGTAKDPKNSLVWHADITQVNKETIMYTTVLVPSIVPRNVKVFSVPNDVHNVNYTFDAKDFEAISVDEISTGYVSVRVYDMARNGDAGAIVYYNPNPVGTLPVLNNRSDAAVVSHVVDALNENDMPVKRVSYITFDSDTLVPSFQTGFFSEELQADFVEKGTEIGAGDMVLISTSGTTITNIEPHIFYQGWSAIVKDDVGIVPADRGKAYFYAKGKLLDFSDPVISILVDDDNPNDGVDKGGLMVFPVMGISTLVRYNEYNDMFEEITPDELNTAYNVGLESADRIVIRTYNDKIKALAVYPAE